MLLRGAGRVPGGRRDRARAAAAADGVRAGVERGAGRRVHRTAAGQGLAARAGAGARCDRRRPGRRACSASTGRLPACAPVQRRDNDNDELHPARAPRSVSPAWPALGALLSGCDARAMSATRATPKPTSSTCRRRSAARCASSRSTRGARVARDAELFVLDADPEIYTRAETAARVEQAQAQLTNLRKSKRPDEIAAIQQQLVQARAAAAASSSRLQRNRELVAKGFVSASVLDELIALAAQDAGRVLEIEANLALARSSAARPDEIAAADAAAAAARAEADLATWREGQARQRAPAAGRRLRRAVPRRRTRRRQRARHRAAARRRTQAALLRAAAAACAGARRQHGRGHLRRLPGRTCAPR